MKPSISDILQFIGLVGGALIGGVVALRRANAKRHSVTEARVSNVEDRIADAEKRLCVLESKIEDKYKQVEELSSLVSDLIVGLVKH